ncbi:MAG: hypothetical protein KY451_14550 [Actinobacteria bacterium]|nr:hypothetical protein [Actinomycetota bacterium]
MRKALALGTVALSLAGLAAAAAPASAADVTATFTVAAGTLSIATAATSANLGTATTSLTGTTVTGTLPKVTVTDNRGSTLGWNSSVASTAFTSGALTIAASKAKAYIVPTNGPTLTSAALSAVPSTTAIDAATGLTLGAAQVFVTATTTASNSVDYTPTVQVTIDSTVAAATYSGTISHTVV